MSDCTSVYAERDKLVAYLSRQYPSFIGPVDDPEPGFTKAVYVQTPEGQLSWHVPDDELPWFAHCDELDTSPWDGHTTEEKYRRLSRL